MSTVPQPTRLVTRISAFVLASMALCAHAASPMLGQVDVFPAQHASTLRDGAPVTAAAAPAVSASAVNTPRLDVAAPPAEPSVPFDVAGEWYEDGRHVIVLNSNDRVVLLCRHCDVPDAVHPGQALPGMPQYRVGRIERGRVVLHGPGGREHVLRLEGAAS